MQHTADLHSKFAPWPHHVWKYGRHPICDCREKARKKKKERRKEETTAAKYNDLPYWAVINSPSC